MLLYIFNNALYEVFREIEEDSNGSWFFLAWSRALYGTQDHHSSLRYGVWMHIQDQRQRYEGFIEGEFDLYINNMLKTSTFAGHPEILALSERYWVNIYIYTQVTKVNPQFTFENDGATDWIYLRYYQRRQHYNTLLIKNEDDIGRNYEDDKQINSKYTESKKIESKLEMSFAEDYETKFSSQQYQAIFNYLKKYENSKSSENWNIPGVYPEKINEGGKAKIKK